MVKFVIAIIKPNRLDAVREALSATGIQGMTVTECKGYGRQRGHREIYRGAEYSVEFVPKLKIEMALDEAVLSRVLEAIARGARTDKIGDGKIFVIDLEEAIRIRTGETGPAAL